MELKDIRNEIDKIDDELVKLFTKRMDKAGEVIALKKEKGLPVLNTAREREILNKVADSVPEKYEVYSRVLFSTLFELSRSYQNRLSNDSEFDKMLLSLVENTKTNFPERAMVACQGVEGAYSELATSKLFALPNILFFRHFEGVFQAVEKGLCRYGILPIENSSYGSVNEVYDLMKSHNFSIVRTLKLHVNHVLLATEGTKLSDIKEVYSHEQAIGQCSEFLRNHPEIKINVCENTAIAAQTVAERKDKTIAAISSSNCAELYGLKTVATNIQNSENNYTRFICISKEPEIYAGANKISFMLSLPHKPGSLYTVMSKFHSLGINLSKLESRPMKGSDFEFMFYFDIDASLSDKKVIKLLSELKEASDQFVFLGAYSEI